MFHKRISIDGIKDRWKIETKDIFSDKILKVRYRSSKIFYKCSLEVNLCTVVALRSLRNITYW